MQDGKLTLSFQPILPGWLFDETGKVSFKYLGHTNVTYINHEKKDTYGEDGVRPSRIIIDKDIVLAGNTITGDQAKAIRLGKVTSIEVILTFFLYVPNRMSTIMYKAYLFFRNTPFNQFFSNIFDGYPSEEEGNHTPRGSLSLANGRLRKIQKY